MTEDELKAYTMLERYTPLFTIDSGKCALQFHHTTEVFNDNWIKLPNNLQLALLTKWTTALFRKVAPTGLEPLIP